MRTSQLDNIKSNKPDNDNVPRSAKIKPPNQPERQFPTSGNPQPPNHGDYQYDGDHNHGGNNHNNNHGDGGHSYYDNDSRHHHHHGHSGYYPHYDWHWDRPYYSWFAYHDYYFWSWYYPHTWWIGYHNYYDFGYYNFAYYYHWYPHHYWIVYPTFNFTYTWQDDTETFTGFIAEDDWDLAGKENFKLNIDYSKYFASNAHWLSDSCPYDGYGIIVKESNGDYNYFHFDKYGNRLAQKLLDRSGKYGGKVNIVVKGVLNTDNHTIKVYSMRKVKKHSQVYLSMYFRPFWFHHRPYRW